MTARVIPFPPRTLAGYRGRCDNCNKGEGCVRILPTPGQIEEWARVHARSWGHTVRLADGRVFSQVNGEGVEYGVYD